MKKIKNTLTFILLFGFFVSCSSSKKLQEEDDFSTDAATETSSDTASPSTAQAEDSEFNLDEKPLEVAAAETPATPKDEFADFNDPAAQSQTASPTEQNQPAPDAPPVKDEFAEFNTPDQTPAVVPTETSTPLPVETPIEKEMIATEVMPEPAKPEPTIEAPAQIQSVQYQSNQQGGTVSIQGDKPLQFTTRLNSSTNQLVVEVQNSTIPSRLKKPLNTKDMASSIGSVDIYQKENSQITRFVIQLRPHSTEPLVQPEGNSLLVIGSANADYIAEQKVNAEKKNEEDKFTPQEGFTDLSSDGVMSSQSLEEFLVGNNKFYGKKISIEISNIDIKEAIKFIAEESGVNLLMDEGLEGKISLKLRQVPWDQALVLILKAKKLGYIRQGNVLRIATLDNLQNEESQAYRLLETRRSNEPLIVKRFFVSYANLKDLELKIKDFISATAAVNNANPIGSGSVGTNAASAAIANGGQTGSNQANSAVSAVPSTTQRGRVLSDERTGSLIVTDTPDNMAKIEKLIAALDTQPKQIVVESKIISATDGFTRSLGVVWGSSGSATTNNSARLGINNGVSGVFDSTFTWGNLDVIGNLDARIALGELQKKVRILNTQRTTVISGGTAKIQAESNLNIPIVQTNTQSNTAIGTSGFTTVKFGLTGDITPQASNENTISADIKLVQVKIDDPKTGSTTNEGIGGKVVTRNGQTVVVQANFQSNNTTDESGVPGLRDIPVLGILFKGKTDIVSKTETMLFSTMTILEPVLGNVKKASTEQPTSGFQ